jgi:hypothetical protein
VERGDPVSVGPIGILTDDGELAPLVPRARLIEAGVELTDDGVGISLGPEEAVVLVPAIVATLERPIDSSLAIGPVGARRFEASPYVAFASRDRAVHVDHARLAQGAAPLRSDEVFAVIDDAWTETVLAVANTTRKPDRSVAGVLSLAARLAKGIGNAWIARVHRLLAPDQSGQGNDCDREGPFGTTDRGTHDARAYPADGKAATLRRRPRPSPTP